MDDKQHRPLVDLVAQLRNLCQARRTGIVFIRPGDGNVVNIGLSQGEITSLSFRRKLGNEALPLLAEIASGQLDFVEDVPTSTKTPLPPTQKILERLSQLAPPDSSATGGAQEPRASGLDASSRAVLEEALAEYIGPMASVVCNNTLVDGQDLQTAIRALAEKIPDRDKAHGFIEALNLKLK